MKALGQGDKRWSKTKLGEGGSTIGVAGCLVTCIAQALREFAVDTEATPLTVQAKALAWPVRAFRGAAAVIAEVAAANGLRVAERVNEVEGQVMLAGVLASALKVGKLALLHVDHDVDRGGDVDADHWVLAVEWREVEGGDPVILYRDPATGDDGTLSGRTLTGPTVWGTKPRIYRVRAVRVVERAT